jgi:hypothetical protein
VAILYDNPKKQISMPNKITNLFATLDEVYIPSIQKLISQKGLYGGLEFLNLG